MNRKKSRTVSVLLAVLFSAALLGGCGSSANNGVPPASGVVTGATTVGINVCTTCHTVQTADWITSKHANAVNGLDSTGMPTLGQIGTCTKNCHDPNGDSANIIAASNIGNVARPVVGCEACHGGGSLHYGSGPISLLSNTTGTVISGVTPTILSGQFVMCTNCHELLDSSGSGTVTAAHDLGGAEAASASGTQYTITDTHFATPNSWRSTDSLNIHNTSTDYIAITGYAMDFSDAKVCVTCHNPHKTATINREWAQSAHADTQGIKIDPTSGAFVGTYSFSSAWAHYNWSTRPDCQRCHTTTGFATYADALASGNQALVDTIRLGSLASFPVTSTADWKPEMLQCRGCHKDNRGTLRNPGRIKANYDYVSSGVTYAKASHTYPDVAGSNVCMACHTAREIGETIKNLNDPALLAAKVISSTTFTNRTLINSHYLTAGATVFTTSGYMYDGRDYDNPDLYMHDKIGTRGAPNTGSNGPCIGCHMSRPNENGNHLFLPVSRVASGGAVTITGITSEVCFQCHGPNDELMRDLVQTQRDLYGESLEALKDILETRGYYFADASPYFYTLRNNAGVVSVTTGSTLVTNVTGSFWVESKVTGTAAGNAIQDRFRVNNDGQYYSILSRVSGTQITLQAPYAGPTDGAAEYTIIGSSVKSWLTTTTPDFPLAAIDTDATGNTTGKNNMGAAFNFNLFEHDPGAYAHNRYYVKRLIYDSIDWLDDNQMNFSVGATLTSICSGGSAPAWCAGAKEYLLPNGVQGFEAERP